MMRITADWEVGEEGTPGISCLFTDLGVNRLTGVDDRP
jgi:hypothetical protein